MRRVLRRGILDVETRVDPRGNRGVNIDDRRWRRLRVTLPYLSLSLSLADWTRLDEMEAC